MSFMKDFKAFAMKGSVVDLAVGVVIGGAFGKIVTALVNDIIMPLVASLTPAGKLFESKFIELPLSMQGNKYQSIEDAKKAGVNVLAYGDFIQSIVDFFIIALSIFAVIRLMGSFRRKEQAAAEAQAAAPPPPTKSEELLTEIRDLLKKQG